MLPVVCVYKCSEWSMVCSCRCIEWSEVCACGAGDRGTANRRQIELERLVERRVQRFLLDLSLLLADALSVVQKHHLHVRICTHSSHSFLQAKSSSLSSLSSCSRNKRRS